MVSLQLIKIACMGSGWGVYISKLFTMYMYIVQYCTHPHQLMVHCSVVDVYMMLDVVKSVMLASVVAFGCGYWWHSVIATTVRVYTCTYCASLQCHVIYMYMYMYTNYMCMIYTYTVDV